MGKLRCFKEDSYSHLTSDTLSLGHYSAHLLCYRRVRRAKEVHAVRDALVERVHARCAPLHHGSCAVSPLRLRVAGLRPCAAVLRVCLPHGVPHACFCHRPGHLIHCAYTVLCSARRPPLSRSPRQGGKPMPLTLTAPLTLAHSWCATTAPSKQAMPKNATAMWSTFNPCRTSRLREALLSTHVEPCGGAKLHFQPTSNKTAARPSFS